MRTLGGFLYNWMEAVSRRPTKYTSTNRITSVWLVRGQIVVLKIFRFDKSTLPRTSFLLSSTYSTLHSYCRLAWIKLFRFLSYFDNCLVPVSLEEVKEFTRCYDLSAQFLLKKYMIHPPGKVGCVALATAREFHKQHFWKNLKERKVIINLCNS